MDWTSIFSNEWFTGIVCGIISGVVVYWITTRAYSRKQSKEYQQRVNTANNEILYTIRPLIVNRSLPTESMWLSLIQATSRKYQVSVEDLYSVSSMRNDLVKEVLDNPFLDTKQKGEYTSLLENFDISFHIEELSEDVAKEIERTKELYQSRADWYSLVMSLIAGVVAGVASKYQVFLMKYNTILIILAILLVAVLCVLFYLTHFRQASEGNMKEKEAQ